MIEQKLFPRWFTIWFYAGTIVLFAGGLANKLAGVVADGFDPLGAAVGVFTMYLLTLLVWRYRELFSVWVRRIPLPAILLSVLVGWFFSQIDELVNFPFNPLFPGVTLMQDLVFTSLMYIPGHMGWFWVLRRYAFTPREAFMTGGLALGFFEIFSGGVGVGALIAIPLLPFVIMVHGTHMVMPKLGLGSLLTFSGQKETRWKYVLGVIIPATGIGLGIGLAYGLAVLTQ